MFENLSDDVMNRVTSDDVMCNVLRNECDNDCVMSLGMNVITIDLN